MSLPQLYSWVEKIPDLPKMVALGITLIGTKEYPGPANNNPVIMGMARDLDIPRSLYPNDETAWCALVHSWICLKTGKPLPGKGVDLLRAKSFTTWGIGVTIPMFGDTLVFLRPGGYHVGMYIGEDEMHYHVMGGNQGNAYSIVRIEKERLHAKRRLYSTGTPSSVKQIIVAPNGATSTNEA